MGSWDEPTKYGLRPVAAAAINDIWTGTTFETRQDKPNI